MGKRNALLAIAAVCAALYGLLLAGVATGAPWVAAFDSTVQGAVFPLRQDALTLAIAFTTELSDTVPCLIVAAAMLAYLLVRRQQICQHIPGHFGSNLSAGRGHEVRSQSPAPHWHEPHRVSLERFVSFGPHFCGGRGSGPCRVRASEAASPVVAPSPHGLGGSGCTVGGLHWFHPRLPGGPLALGRSGFIAALRRRGAAGGGPAVAPRG